LGETFDYTPGSKRLMDTPEPGTIDELCRPFAGTIGIGEDHFRHPEVSKIRLFATAPQALEVVLIKAIAGLTSALTLHLFHASGQQAEDSIKIVDFRNFYRDKHNLQLTGNLFRYS
jgi:hypothetical protein